METSDFYDQRGENALQVKFCGIGSQSIPEIFRAPYSYLEEILPLPRQGAKFLDMGCGTGIHAISAANRGYDVTGIDISRKSLDAADCIAKQYRVESHCKFILTSAIDYLTHSEKFDIIFTSGALYYFDIKEIVPLIGKKLKPGGHFFCVETNGSNWVLNKIRKIRHGKNRDERTTKHLLGLGDIEYMKTQFSKGDAKFFSIYRIPTVPSLSFKFVFHGKKE